EKGRLVCARQSKEITGIQIVVPQELPDRTMEVVRPGLRGDVDNSAGVASKLGVVPILFNSEFPDGVQRRPKRKVSNDRIDVVVPVEKKGIGVLIHSRNIETAAAG